MAKEGHPIRSSVQQSLLRKGSFVTLLLMFSLLATGCSLGGSNKTATPTTPTLRVWRLNQGADSFHDLIDSFKQDKSIDVVYTKKSADNYEFDAFKSMSAHNGPDIWSIPNTWLGDDQQVGVYLPDNYFWKTGDKTGPTPSDQVKLLYPAGIAEQIIDPINKGVFGLPTNVESLQLYYNPDMLSQALQDYTASLGDSPTDDQLKAGHDLLSNPPATWTDLIGQMKYLTKRNGNDITQATIALGAADNIPNSQDILELLMLQNGAQIISQDHKSVLFHLTDTTPSNNRVRPGEKALDFFASFSDPTRATYTWNANMPNALDAFAQGKVAMVIAYTDFNDQLRVKYPDFHPEVAKIPQISAAQAPVNFIRFSVEMVTQNADASVAPFDFLKGYTDSSSASSLASEAHLSTPFLDDLQQQNDSVQAQQIISGKSVYEINHPQFDDAFHQMIVNTTQNHIPAGQAIDAAADRITKLLNPPPSPGLANPTQ